MNLLDDLFFMGHGSERKILEVTTSLNTSKYHDGKVTEVIYNPPSLHFIRRKET